MPIGKARVWKKISFLTVPSFRQFNLVVKSLAQSAPARGLPGRQKCVQGWYEGRPSASISREAPLLPSLACFQEPEAAAARLHTHEPQMYSLKLCLATWGQSETDWALVSLGPETPELGGRG